MCKSGKLEVVVALLNWKVYCDVLLLSVKSTTPHEDIVRLSLEVILSPYGASKSRVSTHPSGVM